MQHLYLSALVLFDVKLQVAPINDATVDFDQAIDTACDKKGSGVGITPRRRREAVC